MHETEVPFKKKKPDPRGIGAYIAFSLLKLVTLRLSILTDTRLF
jgi:hypothetical protein